MPEFIKTNRTGHSLDDAIERTNSHNAQIVRYEGGLRKEYIEWNPLTEHMYHPKIDPRYFKKKKLVMRAGEQIMFKELPPDMLTAGISPYVQIIYKIVQRGGITSHEDIVRAMLNEERVFSSADKYSVDIIEDIIKYMNKGSEKEEGGPYYLLKHSGRLKVGFELPKSYHLVEYKKGYDPIEYHIMQLAKGRGMLSREEIYDYLISHLAWLKTPTKVDMFLERLVKKVNLQRVQRNYFQYVKPLESNK